MKVPKLRTLPFEAALIQAVSKGKMQLATARLRHIASTKWGTRAYMDMEHLYAMEREKGEKPLELPRMSSPR